MTVSGSKREARAGDKLQLNVTCRRRKRRRDRPPGPATTCRSAPSRARSTSRSPTPIPPTSTDFRAILTSSPRNAGAADVDRQQPAPEYAAPMSASGAPTPPFSSKAPTFPIRRLGRLDPRRLAVEPRRHHADPQFEGRRNGDRCGRYGHLRRQNGPGGNQGMNACASLPALAALAGSRRAWPSRFPSGTTAWEMNSYDDFVKGRFDGVSLSREGRLSLAPKVETIFTSDQPVIWSVAQAPDGTLYAATGHRGRVFRIDGSGRRSLLWTADQPEIFALAVDPKGVLYAGTSPDGKVYRIENGKATEYFAPKARYIWSLAAARRRRAVRRHRRSGQDLPRGRAPARAKSITRPASRTSPASRSTRRAACSPAASPTASSTASPPRTRRSCCTTPTCPRSAPSFRCPTARSMRPRSAAPLPSARRARRRRRRARPAAG